VRKNCVNVKMDDYFRRRIYYRMNGKIPPFPKSSIHHSCWIIFLQYLNFGVGVPQAKIVVFNHMFCCTQLPTVESWNSF